MRTVGLVVLVALVAVASAAGGAWWAGRAGDGGARRPAPAWHARVEAARASAEAGSLRATALEVLDTAEDEVALVEAITLLGFVGRPDDAELLASFALARDPVLTEPAIAALGRLGTDEAVDHLIALVDGPPLARGAAVAALGRARDPVAFERLRALVDDPELATSAARGLAAHGGPEAAATLARALEEAELPLVPAFAGALVSLAATEPLADEALRRQLAGARTARRAAVLAALARAGDPTVYDALVADLRGAPSSVAGQAAWALGALGDPRAIPALRAAATDGAAEVRHAALGALATFPQPEATAALLDLVDRGAPSTAARAAEIVPVEALGDPVVLGRLADAARLRPLEVRAAVLSRLFSAPWPRGGAPEEVLALAREALVEPATAGWGYHPVGVLLRHGTPDDARRIAELVRGASSPVRMHVAWSLQQIAGPEPEYLLGLLADDPDPNVRHAALRALVERGAIELVEERLLEHLEAGVPGYGMAEQLLVQIGSERGIEAVLARVERGTRRESGDAIRALAAAGSRAHVERLVAIADRADRPELRRDVLEALVYTDGVDLQPIVDRALRAGEPELEAAAAQALARIGTPEARERLVELAGSDAPQTRTQALSALAQLGGPEAEAALVEALSDPDVAWAALSGLERLGTERARATILDTARASDAPAQVRASVMHQVPRLLGAEAPALLGDAIRDPDETVRSAAIGALESIGSSSAADVLAGVLDDPEATDGDRALAAAALQRVGGARAERERDRIEALAPPVPDTGR